MIELTLAILLLGLAFGVGKTVEASHYRSIHRRENATTQVPVVTFRTLRDAPPVAESRLAVGSVAVSVDYYKRFLAGLRLFFGGELKSYSSLLDRARREAVLRMKESCPDTDIFMNFRFETARVSKGAEQKVACVEILAYSTAIRFADEVRSEAAS